MEGVTYGDLMARAVGHTVLGIDELQHRPARNAGDSYQSLTAVEDLLHALASHADHLMGRYLLSRDPRNYRLDLTSIDIRESTDPSQPSISRLGPQVRAAIGFTNALHAAAGEVPPRHRQRISGHHPLGRLNTATVAVRAATELLETHRTPAGWWRTPESAVLDNFTARLLCLSRIAQMVIILIDAPLTTGLLATHEKTDGFFSHLGEIRASATELRGNVDYTTNTSTIDTTTLAYPNIRTDQPVNELTDRINRLRAAAWPPTGTSHHSGVPALIGFATMAVLIHTRAADTLSHTPGGLESPGRSAPEDDLRGTLRSRAAIWRRARSSLLAMTSYFEIDATFTEDIRAVHELLRGPFNLTTDHPDNQLLADASFTTNLPTADDSPAWPQRSEALVRAAGVFEQISTWNAITLIELAAKRNLFLPAGLVSSAEIALQPDLVIDRARWAPVRVPPSRIKNTLAMYDALGAAATLGELPESALLSPDDLPAL